MFAKSIGARFGAIMAGGLTLAVCFASLPAAALPIQAGSDYRYRLLEGVPSNTNTVDAVATFDGIAEMFAITPTGTATITESQMDLGGGLFQVDISVTADADLFGNSIDSGIFANVGGGNPFDLTGNFLTVSNSLTFFRASGSSFVGSFAPFNGQLWDGTYVENGISFGFNPNASQNDIRRVDLRIVVQQVPEPGTLALFGLGLAGLGFARHRKAA